MEVKNVKCKKIEYPTWNELSNNKSKKFIKSSLLTALIGLISTKSFAFNPTEINQVIPGNMPTPVGVSVTKMIGRRF